MSIQSHSKKQNVFSNPRRKIFSLAIKRDFFFNLWVHIFSLIHTYTPIYLCYLSPYTTNLGIGPRLYLAVFVDREMPHHLGYKWIGIEGTFIQMDLNAKELIVNGFKKRFWKKCKGNNMSYRSRCAGISFTQVIGILLSSFFFINQ